MPNGTYGGVRGKETKVGQKTFVSRPTRFNSSFEVTLQNLRITEAGLRITEKNLKSTAKCLVFGLSVIRSPLSVFLKFLRLLRDFRNVNC